jgi:threonine dehydrogenase-like Zn-dependent dehydrogenase
LACVSAGKTVAVFGAGPVGLLSAHCALLKGASEVYVVDSIPERLEKAEELGATPVDYSKGDPVEQIFALRKKNKGITQSLRPGEEKMKGVDWPSMPSDIRPATTRIPTKRKQPRFSKTVFTFSMPPVRLE